jgi:hypothetical protein
MPVQRICATQGARAVLSMQWSSGPVEGRINHIKRIKRQRYGRASADVRRRRALLDTNDHGEHHGSVPDQTVGLARGSGGSFGRCCSWRRRR